MIMVGWIGKVRERAKSNRLVCTHLSPDYAEFWECTAMLRLGKSYSHSPQMISQDYAKEIIKNLNKGREA